MNENDPARDRAGAAGAGAARAAKEAGADGGGRSPIVRLQKVTKRFGDTVAVSDLSFDIYPGDIFGFIGPNGAGKTTTLKLIATLLRPDSGSISVGGHSTTADARSVRLAIGYMPDFLGVYQGLTVEEYLDFFGAAYRIAPSRRQRLIDDLLQLTDLTGGRSTLVTSLSRGMQQRLGLARALIHDPTVLLLDEPASGLDPRARVEIRELLKELARMGKTIIISSHILSDLEELSTRIGIIEAGRLLYSGELAEALGRLQGGAVYEIELASGSERAAEVLAREPDVASAEAQGGMLRVVLKPEAADAAVLARRLVEGGFALRALVRRAARLEDAFLTITEGKLH
jgi:ABC-2 type transport system ATP-binding protein